MNSDELLDHAWGPLGQQRFFAAMQSIFNGVEERWRVSISSYASTIFFKITKKCIQTQDTDILADDVLRYRIWDYLVAQNLITTRCQARHFLSQCTWSTRLIPPHSLCSILMIVQFRPVAPDHPMKLAILDMSRSPPNPKRRHGSGPQPPSKRHCGQAEPSSSKSTSNSTTTTTTQVLAKARALRKELVTAKEWEDTFEDSLGSFTPMAIKDVDTVVETELNLLYDQDEIRQAECDTSNYEEAIAAVHADGFDILDQLESEAKKGEPSTLGPHSLTWDNNQDLISLQPPSTLSSTPSKKKVQFSTSISNANETEHEFPSYDRSNDSAPSSKPDDSYDSSSDEHESPSQLIMAVQNEDSLSQVLPQPKPLNLTKPLDMDSLDEKLESWKAVLSQHSDNAIDSKFAVIHFLKYNIECYYDSNEH